MPRKRIARPVLNVPLKTAIVATLRQQRAIAVAARIGETTLSHIIRGRAQATPAQRKRLARVLKVDESTIFPPLLVVPPVPPPPSEANV